MTTISQTDTTINITWTPPGPVNGDILSYTIERRFSNDGIFVKAGNLTSNNRDLSYTLSGLSPFTTYIMRVNASNSTHIAEMCEIAGKTMEGGMYSFKIVVLFLTAFINSFIPTNHCCSRMHCVSMETTYYTQWCYH